MECQINQHTPTQNKSCVMRRGSVVVVHNTQL